MVPGELLPAERGHVLRGAAPPRVPDDAVEPFRLLVGDVLAATRASGREHGFLAYAPAAPGAPLAAEPVSTGGRHDIRWRWERRDATVAFSLHSHPGARASWAPSGIDLLGAAVRGDHVVYVLTADGRLAGWRFRDPAGAPRAVEAALRRLADAQALDRAFVEFLYGALDAQGEALVERVYAARVDLAPEGPRAGPTLARLGVR